jgi:hypothetical protein
MSTLAGERRKVVHPVLEREAEREIGGEEEEPMETKVVVEPACKRKDKANEIFSHGAVGGGDRESTVHNQITSNGHGPGGRECFDPPAVS